MTKPKPSYFDAPVSRGEECRGALHPRDEAGAIFTGYPKLMRVHDAVRDPAGVKSWYAKA